MQHVVARLESNLAGLGGRIERARERSEHAAEAVELLVVTKSAPTWLFQPLFEAGVRAVGENRVQSAAERRPEGPADWVWHGIGHLQRNKARRATEAFDVFHALDSVRLARHLGRILEERDRVWPVYLQVNAAGDDAKGGASPDGALAFLKEVSAIPHLRVLGFMTMARLGGSKADVRSTFRTLRHVRDEALRLGVGREPPCALSMGMTDDFDLAVEEGATIVRVGRAVFQGVPMEKAEAERLAATPTPADTTPHSNEDPA
ncbi:MAG: YggS family pyridoxal phosphate-dependent enzyme [Planctomycetota bacterium]|nr:YggS family pyridoxal phosphate-dependent enzyme [Planctomycetota bacterium]